ncbi:MAG TPA: RIP metalloprotease RseP [Longimicrobiales bacterium]|nr:RIP metalloprotease RseP [Longimicrobiales bacterium]
MLTTILATIVVLGVLIFVHELGHFMTAKWVDIEVPRFSIGFGPKVIGFTRGETEYVISALPLGGYVKMAGMEEMEHIEGGPVTVNDTVGDDATQQRGEAAHRPRDFESKSLAARTLVISAGVIMNLLFAVVAFTFIAGVWGVPADAGTVLGGVTEERLPEGAEALTAVEPGWDVARVNDTDVESWRDMTLALTRARAGETRMEFRNAPALTFALPSGDEDRASLIAALEPRLATPAVLAEVMANGPAAQAGLRNGDRILEAGGTPVETWQEFIAVIERSPGQPVRLAVDRNGERFATTVTPHDRELESGIRVGRIDVAVPFLSPDMHLPRERLGAVGAVARGFNQTWEVTALTVDFLGGMITGRHSARNVGGPIMIGQMSGRFARAGAEAFLTFMAILSINLAILNLLPIPVLDGGHLVFLGIEAVRGRALSFEQRMKMTQVGFVFIILLMAWAIGNDLLRAIGI